MPPSVEAATRYAMEARQWQTRSCGGTEMTKEQMLEIIKLLSALESWSFSAGQRMPDYLFERLDKSINELTEEVLK